MNDRSVVAEYQQHPLSAAFPAMDADELSALRDSIQNIGVQNPVTLYEGMVLDGWHRYRCAVELGMSCRLVELADVDPRDFVLAQNRARRNLTASQRAAAVTAVYEWMPSGWNQHGGGCAAAAHPPEKPKSSKELAEIAGVSKRTIDHAKVVERSAAPEIKEAVKAGELPIERAAEIARLPQRQQVKAMREPKPAAPPKADHDGMREQLDAMRAQLDEMARNLAETVADNESMARVFEADDRVTAALAEARRYREQVRVLEERVRSLQAERNEAIRAAKSWQRKAGVAA